MARERDMKKQTEWSRAYNEKSYDRLYPFVPKGRKAEIQAAAEEQGETLNEFIVQAIEERMSRLQDEKRRAEAAKPFVAPEGEFCPKGCKKRGTQIRGPQAAKYETPLSAGVPWCYQYFTELEWKDKEAGICFKCKRCKENSGGGNQQ